MQGARLLDVARRVAPRGARARGATVAAVVVVERLLTPAAVTAIAGGAPQVGLGLGLCAAALLGVRGALTRGGAARTEAALYRRVVSAILEGDVLRADPVADEDVRGAVFEGLHRVAGLLAETLPSFAGNTVAGVLLAGLAFATQPGRVLAAAASALAVGGVGLFAARRWVDEAQSRARRAWIKVADEVGDAAEAKIELAASGRHGEFVHRFDRAATLWDREARRAGRFAGMLGRLPVALLAGAVAAVLAADALLGGASLLAASVRAAVLASYAPAFLGLAQGIQGLVSHGPRLRLVDDVLRTARGPVTTGRRAPAPRADVECRDLAVSYGAAERAALRGISFTWKRGELLALAGPNGSGKSTCLRALVGLCAPASGAVLVGGVALSDLDLATWRRSIAFLPQRPYLPPRATVSECLRLLDADAPEAALRDALDRVGLREPLGRLAGDPLDAPVGVLSAGQRQCVALARALARDAFMLVLDEPDADLDQEAARRLANHLRELSRERMVIVAAHGPELLAAADRVVTLEA